MNFGFQNFNSEISRISKMKQDIKTQKLGEILFNLSEMCSIVKRECYIPEWSQA